MGITYGDYLIDGGYYDITPEQERERERCPYCDGTGDVHSIDGEWRGICDCPAGDAIRRTTPSDASQADSKSGGPMAEKLTARQQRMLRELGKLADDQAWLVSGHNRIACNRLVDLGLAIHVGGDGLLHQGFRLTDAGRASLSNQEE